LGFPAAYWRTWEYHARRRQLPHRKRALLKKPNENRRPAGRPKWRPPRAQPLCKSCLIGAGRPSANLSNRWVAKMDNRPGRGARPCCRNGLTSSLTLSICWPFWRSWAAWWSMVQVAGVVDFGHPPKRHYVRKAVNQITPAVGTPSSPRRWGRIYGPAGGGPWLATKKRRLI